MIHLIMDGKADAGYIVAVAMKSSHTLARQYYVVLGKGWR